MYSSPTDAHPGFDAYAHAYVNSAAYGHAYSDTNLGADSGSDTRESAGNRSQRPRWIVVSPSANLTSIGNGVIGDARIATKKWGGDKGDSTTQ